MFTRVFFVYICLAALQKDWKGIWRFESVCMYSLVAIYDYDSLLSTSGLRFGRYEESLYNMVVTDASAGLVCRFMCGRRCLNLGEAVFIYLTDENAFEMSKMLCFNKSKYE
jgi:hypothetical protein